ncbi:leucine-, isoleucine-, valine-, threonine-, and alanine-binding protein precursor [Oxobacter pfennigii]|uniref:Leucine-, isoleucine-, valine-, threonine-, and alanine-binding protein n=1 Tax=Oxobacter pfennigii TaxID=36849 RepID=A0A0P8W5U9_9CLOT|nr:ABC transporter substrate-binding protein [Oxobacter pfennigii]KPU44070.1 leucine-, isoleucine-, valine-, threonine-, and alanine-binding protein precursor [Oxobacter pfennigii]
MRKKSSILLSFMLVLALVLTACSGQGGSNNNNPTTAPTGGASAGLGAEVKIGAVLPMTGDVATFGKSSKQGLDLLIEQYNANGGINGSKIVLVVEDDENKPESGVAALQKLINNDKVVGVVGSVASKVTLAMAPVATQSKVPMVSSSSTNPGVTALAGNEYAFRACFIDPFQGTVIAKFASETLKAKTAAVLYDVANDYTVGLAEFFTAAFEAAGGKVVSSQSYNTGDTDFNAQLTTIKPLNPDVLILTDYYQTVGLIAKQARNLGITGTFLGGDGWDSPDLVTIAGDSIEGGYFSNHYSSEDTSPEVTQFLNDYKAKYNETPDALAALAYDAGKMLLEAIKKANSTDGAAIVEALKATDMTSVTGTIKLDENRNPVKPAVMIQIKDGKQAFASKVNP